MLDKIKINGIGNFPLIEIIIDDYGNLVLWEGNNRAAICSFIGLEYLPVHVMARSDRWVKFKQQLIDEYGDKRLYNPINHPDFITWNFINQPMRFDWIYDFTVGYHKAELKINDTSDVTYDMLLAGGYRKDTDIRHFSLLDLGCHYGYFSHMFADYNFDVIGIEQNKMYYEGAKYLNHYNKHFVDFINGDIFWYVSHCEKKFDVVLTLNVIYHLLKLPELCSKMLKKIGDICKLFFTDYTLDENMPIGDFKRMIMKETGFREFHSLGKNPTENREMIVFCTK